MIHTAGAGGNFYTVHVATPIEYCEQHDRKGVFARARTGELRGVAGVDEVYEVPERADLTVDVSRQSIPEIVHSTFSSSLSAPCSGELIFLRNRYCTSARS